MMKVCPNCGAQVPDEIVICSGCGAAFPPPAADRNAYMPNNPQPVVPPIGQPYGQPDNRPLTFAEFFQAYAASGTKTSFTVLGVIAVITAVVSIVLIFLTGSLFGILDVAVYGVLAVLLLALKKRSFELPLAMVIYSGVWTIVGIATGGTPGGIVVLVVGITTCIKMKKLKDAYKRYTMTGDTPVQPI